MVWGTQKIFKRKLKFGWEVDKVYGGRWLASAVLSGIFTIAANSFLLSATRVLLHRKINKVLLRPANERGAVSRTTAARRPLLGTCQSI